MKKYIIICLAVLVISAPVFVLRNHHQVREKGEIEEAPAINSEEFFHHNEDLVNKTLYNELCGYIYTGEVNYRDLVFEFVEPEDKETPIYTRYECSVYEPDDPQGTRTRYEVILDDHMELNYITGPQESTYECSFENGELTVNGTKLDKTKPNTGVYLH